MPTEPILLPLDQLHRGLEARMVDFAGYSMPVQYPSGIKREHLHTREKCGLFDVSHMGQIRVTAKDNRLATLHIGLEAALPVDFENWPVGLQRYSLLLNERGGIEDDVMVINLGNEIRLVVNAGNRQADWQWLHAHCPSLDFSWVDAALIALQGPLAQQVLGQMDPEAAQMTFMQTKTLDLLGAPCLTSRSGYTGEDGYEISIPSEHAQSVVTQLLAHPDVEPIGLGARDSLRLEAGLPLHGNDITPNTTPVQAGLSFAIARTRRSGEKQGGFPGAQTILDQFADKPDLQLVGLISDDGIPVRAGAAIVDDSGEAVGTVSSGTISPTLNQPVMLAWLDVKATQSDGARLFAQVRNKRPAVQVTPLPFVEKRYKR